MELQPDVIAFIEKHIHSVAQLEVLLLLRERGGEWTPAAIAGELRITDQSAEFRLRDLQLRRLLAVSTNGEAYRYEPETPELERSVGRLADAYRDMKYSVINAIFAVPGDSARALAEAFRIRKPREED